jgi:asparagine N-glycosylation enzyme membrane subunit Stt3
MGANPMMYDKITLLIATILVILLIAASSYLAYHLVITGNAYLGALR